MKFIYNSNLNVDYNTVIYNFFGLQILSWISAGICLCLGIITAATHDASSATYWILCFASIIDGIVCYAIQEFFKGFALIVKNNLPKEANA